MTDYPTTSSFFVIGNQPVSTYFFSPEQADRRDVFPVTVPGLPKTVYASRELAQQLTQMIADNRAEAAMRLVQWLGGMQYQN